MYHTRFFLQDRVYAFNMYHRDSIRPNHKDTDSSNLYSWKLLPKSDIHTHDYIPVVKLIKHMAISNFYIICVHTTSHSWLLARKNEQLHLDIFPDEDTHAPTACLIIPPNPEKVFHKLLPPNFWCVSQASLVLYFLVAYLHGIIINSRALALYIFFLIVTHTDGGSVKVKMQPLTCESPWLWWSHRTPVFTTTRVASFHK